MYVYETHDVSFINATKERWLNRTLQLKTNVLKMWQLPGLLVSVQSRVCVCACVEGEGAVKSF